MKILAVVLFLISTISFSYANTVKAGSELLNYACATKDSPSLKFNIKITATANSVDEENVKIPAALTITRILPIGSEVLVVPQVFLGKFTYEDVVSEFISNDRKTAFTLYADELDQTILETPRNGKTVRVRYNCN